MAQIIWTDPALSDLAGIADYIALDNFSASQRLIRKVFTTADHLEVFPESGRTPPELDHSPYREIIVGPCRIFYRYDNTKDKVYILYIMRGERQLRKYLIDYRSKKYNR